MGQAACCAQHSGYRIIYEELYLTLPMLARQRAVPNMADIIYEELYLTLPMWARQRAVPNMAAM